MENILQKNEKLGLKPVSVLYPPSFLPLTKMNEFNCLEFSNNKIIQILTKIIIFKRGTMVDKFEEIKIDTRFSNYEHSFLLNLLRRIESVLKEREKKTGLNPEEEKFIIHLVLNLINNKGRLNKNEALKIIKTKLFLNTSKFDSNIFKIINSIKERKISLDKYAIPKFILPKETGMYLIEKKNEFLLGLGPKFLNINSHILFFNEQKLFGIGLIHSINKEGIINNHYNILPFLVITNDNVIHSQDLDECVYPVKNIPFCVITYEQSESIIRQITGTKEYVTLGARLVGDQLLKKSSNSLLWYNLSYAELLDMFEKRLIIYGTPSSGKSILGIQILRFLSNKNRRVISISPNNPNLSKFGLSLKSIGVSNPKWDLEDLGSKYIKKYGKEKLESFSQITLGEEFFMPNIENLNKKTIIALINEVTGSVQVKNIIALEMVDRSLLEILNMAIDETLLDPDDFQQNQIKTVKRIANILLKWQSIGNKINIKELLISKDKTSLGFYINSELFLPELVFIILAEIFYNSKPCFDIKSDGFFLMIDEIPLLMTSDGVLIKGKNIGRIFTQINKQGRNMGILLGSIIQDYTRNIQKHFLPLNLNDYSKLHLFVKNKRRIIKINNEIILIPPVTNI